MIEIKLCGLKEPSHIKVAFNLGIKYVGLVLYKKSPRYLNRETARSLISNSPPGIKKVGLVVDPNNDFLDAISDIDLDMLQLHGTETLDRVKEIKSKVNVSLIKAVGVKDKKDLELVEKYAEIADQILIDAKPNFNNLPGGNGVPFDWKILEDIGVAIAPGLDFGNYCSNIYVRFSFPKTINIMSEGIKRIDNYLTKT